MDQTRQPKTAHQKKLGAVWRPGLVDRPPWSADQAHGPHCLNLDMWRLLTGPLGQFSRSQSVAPSYKYKGNRTHTHTHTVEFRRSLGVIESPELLESSGMGSSLALSCNIRSFVIESDYGYRYLLEVYSESSDICFMI